MTVTITPAGTSDLIGPGLLLKLASDFIGPLANPVQWNIQIAHAATPTVFILEIDVPFTSKTQDVLLMSDRNQGIGLTEGEQLRQEDSVHVLATLRANSVPQDTGTVTAQWEAQDGVGVQQLQLAQQASSSGTLSGAQAAQLTDIQTKVTDTQVQVQPNVTDASGTTTPHTLQDLMSYVSMDSLTSIELTSGPTSGFVGHDLTAFAFAIIIRLTALPPGLTPRTPDDDYYSPTLAVVRIFHGSDLFLRVPIHTTSRIIALPSDIHTFFAQALEGFLWPNAMTLQVTMLPGVSCQVFEQVIPGV